MPSKAHILNQIVYERARRDPKGAAVMVQEYLQQQVGESSGVFGIAVEDVRFSVEKDTLHLSFVLHLDNQKIRHKASWSGQELLTFTVPLTTLMRDELRRALSNLLGV